MVRGLNSELSLCEIPPQAKAIQVPRVRGLNSELVFCETLVRGRQEVTEHHLSIRRS